jgi:NAD(P)-dependent dehydrogenase (short-subunit alcohol dehydrogenase family)
MLLEGKIALVSGIGPGLGRDISLRLADEGAHLVLAARTESRLAEVAKEVEARGRRALCVPTDITQDADANNVVKAAVVEFGRLDIVVNNAFHAGTFGRFEADEIDGGVRETVEVNLFGSLRVSQAAIPVMKDQGGGSIVMINTMSIRNVREGYSAYAASKAGLEAAARGMARELGPYGIRVNSVLPGYIWGPNVQAHFERRAEQEGRTPQEIYDEVASEIALRTIPTSHEIAGSVVFYASDLSRGVTGTALDVNGGHWISL